MEYGCGDCNQLSMIECNKIIGVDVSETAIKLCKTILPNSKFVSLETQKFPREKTDLLLSLDVIYHLMVYLESNNIKIEDVMKELKKRRK